MTESQKPCSMALSDIAPPPIPSKPMTPEEFAQFQVKAYNSIPGNLTGYDCPDCLNRGAVARLDEKNELVKVPCGCMKIREAIRTAEKSGFGLLLEEYTLDSYEVHEDWQKRVKNTASIYLRYGGGCWLYVSGQSGCGKSHICTAVCNELLKAGRTVKYMLWRDVLHEMQSLQFKPEYADKRRELQSYDVLYIDDFMKNGDRNKLKNEVTLAYEIINARYNAKKQTVISSELFLSELEELDAATAGRIREMCGGYLLQIERRPERNQRLKSAE